MRPCLAILLEGCCRLLAGQALEVGQGLLPALAVLDQDVQVHLRLLGRLRHVQRVLKVAGGPADLQ